MPITPVAKPTPPPSGSMSQGQWVWRHSAFSIGDPGSHYNGFSWDERIAVTPIQKRATQAGLISKPKFCRITGAHADDQYVYQHNENYGEPLEYYAVARFIHAALHARFTDPLPWNRIVRKHYVHGAWFTFLTMDPEDMKRPYVEVYPYGLPKDGEPDPELATALGISPLLFSTSKREVACNGLQRGNLFRDGVPQGMKGRHRSRG